MQRDVSLHCPIEPHQLAKDHRRGIEDIVRRVTMSCTVQGAGRELLLRIYLAGMYHGIELTKDQT
jgi:hypothetical protein